MNTAAELPEPTQAEVNELAEVITDAKLNHGISAGHWSLARFILAAGYRKLPEPEPARYGQCCWCKAAVPLTRTGYTEDHDAPRGHNCTGSRLMPLRRVDPPEVVS